MGCQRRSSSANIERIEEVFRQEKEIRELVLEKKLGQKGHTGGAPTGHSFISDPTASQALRNADEVDFILLDDVKFFRPEAWLMVVDAVKNWCSRDVIKSEIYKRRYTVGESSQSTCIATNIEINTYYYFLKEIRSYALQCAAQMQVIRIF